MSAATQGILTEGFRSFQSLSREMLGYNLKGNEATCSIKGEEFLDWLSDC
jgi:hypothetical protein